MNTYQKTKGTYCLLLHCEKNITITVGAIGSINFKKGCYIYVGSAMNGIRQRVARHIKKHKTKRWHIDYLTTNQSFSVEKVFTRESTTAKECQTAKWFQQHANPIPRFGASDCRCNSHLFQIDNHQTINWQQIKMSELDINTNEINES